MVTPVGNDTPSTWASLRAGKSGVGEIRYFDASGFPVRIGAEVKNFELPAVLAKTKHLKFASRSHRFALAAAEEALSDAGIRPQPDNAERWGLSVGAGMMAVSFPELEVVRRHCSNPDGDFQPDGFLNPDFPTDPISFCRTQTNAGLALLTQHFGMRGYATAVHTACASGRSGARHCAQSNAPRDGGFHVGGRL